MYTKSFRNIQRFDEDLAAPFSSDFSNGVVWLRIGDMDLVRRRSDPARSFKSLHRPDLPIEEQLVGGAHVFWWIDGGDGSVAEKSKSKQLESTTKAKDLRALDDRSWRGRITNGTLREAASPKLKKQLSIQLKRLVKSDKFVKVSWKIWTTPPVP